MKLCILITLLPCLLITDAKNICRTPDYRIGRCVLIDSCNPMLDAVERLPKPFSPKMKHFLKSFQCGSENGRRKVCCPSGPIYRGPSSQPPDVSNHTNLRLLPKNCGYLHNTDKIASGKKTGLFEFPWMAILTYKNSANFVIACGGTIINERYILTAAHCVVNSEMELAAVRVGEHNLKTTPDCERDELDTVCAPPFQDLKIEKVVYHDRYYSHNDNTYYIEAYNDIALIRVSQIDLSRENTRPVCLPLDETRNYNFTNKKVVVTGWGFTESGVPSHELLKVELRVIPLRECQKLYGHQTILGIQQLCAGGKGKKDSCEGDSGGPLQVVGFLHGDYRYIQQGIVSFGPEICGITVLPGVYTRVAYFMDWILDNIEP